MAQTLFRAAKDADPPPPAPEAAKTIEAEPVKRETTDAASDNAAAKS